MSIDMSLTTNAVPYANTIAFKLYVNSHPRPAPAPDHAQRRLAAAIALIRASEYLEDYTEIDFGKQFWKSIGN